MIVETIDQGWGPEHPLKQLEIEITNAYLKPYQNDASRTVQICSTWYDGDLHERTLARLRQNPPDRVVLISMVDASIPQPEQFADLGCEVRSVGCYPGQDYIDYWSLVVDRYMCLPDLDLLDTSEIDTAFMCLNRKPHWHRVRLYQQIEAAGLLDYGLVSLGGDNGPALRLLPEDSGGTDIAPNGGPEQNGIANDIASLGHPRNWSRHFLNVVTETEYDISGRMFVTEKIYKPIVGCRPFLVYAQDGAQDWLKQHGFESYADDFQDITDLELRRPDNIVPFLKTLVDQGHDYWRHKLQTLRGKICYNKDHFSRHVAAQKQKIQKGIECLT